MISTVERSQLFYGRYVYSLKFTMANSFYMRKLARSVITNMYAVQNHRSFVSRGLFSDPVVQARHDNSIDLCQRLLDTKVDFKRQVYWGSQCIYSNDLDFLMTLYGLHYVQQAEICQALVTRPRDRVQLRRSTHRFRSWFKERGYSEDEKQLLKDFLLTRISYFKITPKLHQRLRGEHFFDQPTGYDFIDHDSEHDVLMLTMVVPNCIRKTLPIEVVDK